MLPNGMTGYEIRVNTGPTPPATRDEGTLLATLADTVTSYTHTGAASNTQFSYSLWATTSNALIASNPVSAGATTPKAVPSPAQSLSAAKTSTTTHTLTWNAPAAAGTDLKEYVVKYRTDGVNPTATTGTELATVALGVNSYVASGLVRNLTYRWAVFPRTFGGKYGAGAFVSQNSNEAVPSAVSNLTAWVANYQNLSCSWDRQVRQPTCRIIALIGQPMARVECWALPPAHRSATTVPP